MRAREGKTEDQKIRACLLGPPGEGRQQGERGRRRKGKIVEPKSPRKELDWDWSATADRLEVTIDCLTNRAVASEVEFDNALAARIVAYARNRAAGGKEDTDTEAELDWFLTTHNQSFDWVFRGEVGGMICNLAAGTSSRKPPQLCAV